MSDRVLRVAVALVALAGAAVAGYLTYVHYRPDALDLHGRRRRARQCRSRRYAELVGVPVALLGLLAYPPCSALVAWDFRLARTLAAAIALTRLGFAVYLVVLQAFVIDAWCVWCLVNDLVDRAAARGADRCGASSRQTSAELTSSGPGGGCSTRCGRGSPSGSRRSR